MIIVINTLRHVSINRLIKNDFFVDSLTPLFNREGSYNSKSVIISPYFTKRIGADKSNEISIVSNYLNKLEEMKIPYKFVDRKIDFDFNYNGIDNIKKEFSVLDDKFSNVEAIVLNAVDSCFRNIRFSDQLSKGTFVQSIVETINLFLKSDKNRNKSKLLNFVIKLFYWLDCIFYDCINNNKIKSSMFINSKIIYSGEISKHETFLLLCLFKNGIDILYLNSTHDSLIESNPFLVDYAYEVILPMATSQYKYKVTQEQAPKAEKIKAVTTPVTRSATSTSRVKSVEFSPSVVVKKREFKGDLNEVTSLSKERIGYLGLPSAVIPTYFIRYIGVSKSIEEYKNKIFNIDKVLKRFSYLKLEGSLYIGNPTDLLNETKLIWSNDVYHKTDIHSLMLKLNGTNALNFIGNEILKNQVLYSLELTLALAFEDQEILKASKIKNITIKLLSWLKDYYDTLLKNVDYKSENIPKVLFYGDIKIHEALFLILLYNLGIDIIYINTYGDSIFESIDPTFSFSDIYVNDTVSSYFNFPKKESLIRQETVAFKASEEIDKLIHNDQDGVYKPWQFENYVIRPVTLKTTFDEMMILWKEESRFRTGFKVIDKTIYVPNLFVKISGAHSNIDDYFKFISTLSDEPQSILINELPISKNVLNKQEMYRLASVIDRSGSINTSLLKESSLYKYGYLNDNIQSTIIKSIEELFELGILKIDISASMRLKILSTIINLDKKILELLQNFDYPSTVPKIIIYDSKESVFSIEDSIILSFLYINGFDVCVLTPTGYNNFEMHIESKYYDIFRLETKQFNLDLPDLSVYKSKKQKSFWSNIFG